MAIFKKISELSANDRTKLKGYWEELWGSEYAEALITDFKMDKKAKSKSLKKKADYQTDLKDVYDNLSVEDKLMNVGSDTEQEEVNDLINKINQKISKLKNELSLISPENTDEASVYKRKYLENKILYLELLIDDFINYR